MYLTIELFFQFFNKLTELIGDGDGKNSNKNGVDK